MKHRTLISLFLSSMIGVALVNPAFAKSPVKDSSSSKLTMQKQSHQQQVNRLPRGGSTFSTQSSGPQGLKHDSDAQLDVWVARCNKAGGGMILRNDGNYDCVGPQGYPIPW